MSNPKFDSDDVEPAEDWIKKLQSKVFRWDCPDPDLLGDFVLQNLESKSQQQVQEHLESCFHCQQEIEGLADYLNFEEPPSPQGIESESSDTFYPSIWSWLLSTVTGSVKRPLKTAALRGGSRSPIRLTLEAESLAEPIDLFLDIVEQGDQFRLDGLLSYSEQMEAQLEESIIEIWQSGELVSLHTLDEDSAFTFLLKKLSPIIFRLMTHTKDVIIAHIELE